MPSANRFAFLREHGAEPSGHRRHDCGHGRRSAGRVRRRPGAGAAEAAVPKAQAPRKQAARRNQSGAEARRRNHRLRACRRKRGFGGLRPADLAASVARLHGGVSKQESRPRVVSTDKLDKPTVTAIEAAAASGRLRTDLRRTRAGDGCSGRRVADAARHAAAAGHDRAALRGTAADPVAAPAAAAAAAPMRRTGRARQAQAADSTEPKEEQRVAKKAKRKAKAEPKAPAKQDVDDDDDTLPAPIPTTAFDDRDRWSAAAIGARAGSSSAGPSATTTCRMPRRRTAPGHRDPARQRRRAVRKSVRDGPGDDDD